MKQFPDHETARFRDVTSVISVIRFLGVNHADPWWLNNNVIQIKLFLGVIENAKFRGCLKNVWSY